MNSIQWHYQPSPEELKKSKLVPRILGISFHSSGLIYALVYYLEGMKNTVFAVMLGILYAVGLIFWHLYLKKHIGLHAEEVDINDERIRIFDLDLGKEKNYNWSDLRSFSYDVNVYMAKDLPRVPKKEDPLYKFFYLGYKKDDFIPLRVPNSLAQEFESALKERLEEIKS